MVVDGIGARVGIAALAAFAAGNSMNREDQRPAFTGCQEGPSLAQSDGRAGSRTEVGTMAEVPAVHAEPASGQYLHLLPPANAYPHGPPALYSTVDQTPGMVGMMTAKATVGAAFVQLPPLLPSPRFTQPMSAALVSMPSVAQPLIRAQNQHQPNLVVTPDASFSTFGSSHAVEKAIPRVGTSEGVVASREPPDGGVRTSSAAGEVTVTQRAVATFGVSGNPFPSTSPVFAAKPLEGSNPVLVFAAAGGGESNAQREEEGDVLLARSAPLAGLLQQSDGHTPLQTEAVALATMAESSLKPTATMACMVGNGTVPNENEMTPPAGGVVVEDSEGGDGGVDRTSVEQVSKGGQEAQQRAVIHTANKSEQANGSLPPVAVLHEVVNTTAHPLAQTSVELEATTLNDATTRTRAEQSDNDDVDRLAAQEGQQLSADPVGKVSGSADSGEVDKASQARAGSPPLTIEILESAIGGSTPPTCAGSSTVPMVGQGQVAATEVAVADGDTAIGAPTGVDFRNDGKVEQGREEIGQQLKCKTTSADPGGGGGRGTRGVDTAEENNATVSADESAVPATPQAGGNECNSKIVVQTHVPAADRPEKESNQIENAGGADETEVAECVTEVDVMVAAVKAKQDICAEAPAADTPSTPNRGRGDEKGNILLDGSCGGVAGGVPTVVMLKSGDDQVQRRNVAAQAMLTFR